MRVRLTLAAGPGTSRVLKELSTIPLTFFPARKKEALRLLAPIESGHIPFFISPLEVVDLKPDGYLNNAESAV